MQYLKKLFLFSSFNYQTFGIIRLNQCITKKHISPDIKKDKKFEWIEINFNSGKIIFSGVEEIVSFGVELFPLK